MADASTGEVAGIISATVVGIVAIGKGLQWLLGWLVTRADSRAAKLQAWHEELAGRERAIDRDMDERLRALEVRSETHAEQNQALRMAFELVASALRSIDPKNTALSRAEQLLQTAFPLMPIVPPDMTADLKMIDRKDLAMTAAARRTGEAA